MKRCLIFCAVATVLGLASAGLAQDVDRGDVHAVFVMTNAADHNEVWAYRRLHDGTLRPEGRFATGGRGSGGTVDPLGSQGSLTLSQDRELLFAVNAGSGDISVFRVHGPRLDLLTVTPSGGSAPVAVAQHDDLVYVVNFAGNSNVEGFHLAEGGGLTPIPHALHYLSASNSGGASLAFSPDGHFLLVTEKLTNNIDVFPVGPGGVLAAAVVHHDAVPGTFSVIFTSDGAAVVVETGVPGASNAGAISSFTVDGNGALTQLSTNVPTLGAATCWNAGTPDGRFVYTANSGTSNISGFAVVGAGLLNPLPGTTVATFPAGSIDLDAAISADGKFLYTLNTGTGAIGIVQIHDDGTLSVLGVQTGLTPAAGFNGIAAL